MSFKVLEHLNASLLADTDVTRGDIPFTTDGTIPPPFRARPSQFTKTGYDRGHLAPAGDNIRSEQAMRASFLMTNISPQVGRGFNRECKLSLLRYNKNIAQSGQTGRV